MGGAACGKSKEGCERDGEIEDVDRIIFEVEFGGRLNKHAYKKWSLHLAG